MDRRRFILGSLAAMAAASTSPANAAEGAEPDCGHWDHPSCHTHPHAIVGSWFGTAEVPDYPSIKDLLSFIPNGVVMESARPAMRELPAGMMYVTAGHGAWKKIDDANVEVFYRILLQSVDTGEQYGVEDVSMKLCLHGHNKLSGTWQAQITDLVGSLITSGGGNYHARRIKA